LGGAVIAGLIALVMGMVLTWVGWRHWRYRNEETIGALEASILKMTGESPLPRTRVDRFLTYLQASFGFVLGPFFLLVGVVIILGELGLI